MSYHALSTNYNSHDRYIESRRREYAEEGHRSMHPNEELSFNRSSYKPHYAK